MAGVQGSGYGRPDCLSQLTIGRATRFRDRKADKMKSTSLLYEDHGHIRKALSILEQLSERALHDERIRNNDILSVIAFLQQFAGQHHHGKEEQIFFPALLRRGQASHYREV